MQFELAGEQAQIRDMVRSLATKEFASKAAEIDEHGLYPEANLSRLAELGLLGMLVPAPYGGSETGAVSYAIALEEVARGCASTGVLMAVTNMVGETIYRFGSEEQRRRFLADLFSGDGKAAFAITEPSAGSDAFGISTVAVPDGDAYVLNGSKNFITNGSRANVAIVTAVTQKEPGKQISAFLVESGTRGYSSGRPERKLGLRGSDTVSLTFEDCRVPRRNLLGEEGEGFRIVMAALDGGRVGIASQAIGIARAIPIACEAIPTRPPSSAAMTIRNPSPSSPSRFRLGTRQSSKVRDTVSDPLNPSFRSGLPLEYPRVPLSTRKALICFPGSFCVTAVTMATFARDPLVMKFLLPFSTYASPSGTATVEIPKASDPAEGSVIANAAFPSPENRSARKRRRCSSLPKR